MPAFSVPSAASQVTQTAEQGVNSPARVALRQAQETSFGFFVPQDSAFGNLFLPVLPRFDGAATTTVTPPTSTTK